MLVGFFGCCCCCCDKVLDIDNLRKDWFWCVVLVHSPWLFSLLCLGPGWGRATWQWKQVAVEAAPKNMSLVTYLLQLGPTYYFSPPPNSTIILWIHQVINPSLWSEHTGSNHFSKAYKLATKTLIHKPVENIFKPLTLCVMLAIMLNMDYILPLLI
jgi:hypothetical protein